VRPALGNCALTLGLVVAAAATSRVVSAQSPCRHAAIRSPFAGQVVRGVEPVLGSASIDAFAFYKLEWAPADDPETWSALSTTKLQPVVNGLLDEWNTTVLPDGSYRLKLTVVDTAAQEPCRVTVEDLLVANHVTPSPTPTITATAAAPPALPSVPAPTSEARTPFSPTPPPVRTTLPAETATRMPEPSRTAAPLPTDTPPVEAELTEVATEAAPSEIAAGTAGAETTITPTATLPTAGDGDEASGTAGDAGTAETSVVAPTLADLLGLAALGRAFLGGVLAAALVAVAVLVTLGLRRPR